jgi:hypothetical protein
MGAERWNTLPKNVAAKLLRMAGDAEKELKQAEVLRKQREADEKAGRTVKEKVLQEKGFWARQAVTFQASSLTSPMHLICVC